MKKKKNLKKLLNLHIIDLTNCTYKCGEYDLPYITCNNDIPHIDYLATYSQPNTYFKTPQTCVSYFEYDVTFDGFNGLWNGIYYKNEKILNKFKERFKGVKYFIAPDYSKCGDVPEIENKYRQFKARIVSIWLTMNLDAIVIPLISTGNRRQMEYMLDGMEDCEVAAFNAKGAMGSPKQLIIFKEAIEYAVDHLPKLKRIVVYSSSPNISKVEELFEYAINKGIEVEIPNNMLQTRNKIRGEEQ